MKQYTTPEQTAKLIELGFEKPKSIIYASAYQEEEGASPDVEYEYAYSIGELIEILPKEIINVGLRTSLFIYIDHNKMWVVEYNNALGELLSTCRTELIDALYDMFFKLKEEVVI